jgi:hypothetical protein
MVITSMTTLGGYREGKLAINFDDGGLYSISKGHHMNLGGFISGNMWTNFTKTMTITDHINGIVAEFEYEYKPAAKKGMMASMTSYFKKKTTKKEPYIDEVKINIVKESGFGSKKKKEIVSVGEGSWCSHLNFDDKNYWLLTDPAIRIRKATNTFLCPSETMNRPDIVCCRNGDMEGLSKIKKETE